MRVEYRVCWSASSNISFKGTTDWHEWEGDEDLSPEEISDALMNPPGGDRDREIWSSALQQAVDVSGFEYWVETREAPNG